METLHPNAPEADSNPRHESQKSFVAELEEIVAEREERENALAYLDRELGDRNGTEAADMIEGRTRRPAFELEIGDPESREILAREIGERSCFRRELETVASESAELFDQGTIKEPLPDLEEPESHLQEWEQKYLDWQRLKSELEERRRLYYALPENQGWGCPPLPADYYSAEPKAGDYVLSDGRFNRWSKRPDELRVQDLADIDAGLTEMKGLLADVASVRQKNLEAVKEGRWPNPTLFAQIERELSWGREGQTSPGALIRDAMTKAGLGFHDRTESDPSVLARDLVSMLESATRSSLYGEAHFGGSAEGGWVADIYADASDAAKEEASLAKLSSALGMTGRERLKGVLGREAVAERFNLACKRLVPADIPLAHATSDTRAVKIIESGGLSASSVTGERNAGGVHTGGVHWASPGYVSPGYGRFGRAGEEPVIFSMTLGDLVESTPAYTETSSSKQELLAPIEVGTDIPASLAKKLAEVQELRETGMRIRHIDGGESGRHPAGEGDPFGGAHEMVFAMTSRQAERTGGIATGYTYPLDKLQMLCTPDTREKIEGKLAKAGIDRGELENLFAPVASTIRQPTPFLPAETHKGDLWMHGSDLMQGARLKGRQSDSRLRLVGAVGSERSRLTYDDVRDYRLRNGLSPH